MTEADAREKQKRTAVLEVSVTYRAESPGAQDYNHLKAPLAAALSFLKALFRSCLLEFAIEHLRVMAINRASPP